MRDIAPGLLEKIKADFNKNLAADKRLLEIKSKILKKDGTFEDAAEYATRAGKLLANALNAHISVDELPNGRMYYNIASRVLDPALSELHSHVSIASAEVQEMLNKRAKLGIKAVLAEKNQSRIDGIVNRVASAEKFTDVAWMLDEPIINFSQSIVDDTIKANVDFHAKAGLRPQIIRKEAGDCCDWCKSLAGTYDYPAPQEVYQRHRYCRCTVEYDPRDGKRQDVHTKKWTDPEKNDKIKRRIHGEKSHTIKNNVIPLRDSELIYQDPYQTILKTENYNKWESSVTAKERVEILDYTGSDYYQIMNDCLRGKLNIDDVGYKKQIEEKINRLDFVLSKFATPDQYTVYRGTYNRHGVEKVKIGESFILDKGFASSSFAESITEDFSGIDGDVLYRIRIPKGKRVGAYVDLLSKHKGEEEFLFRPNTKVKLLKINKEDRPYGIRWVYDLEVQ